MTAGDVPNLGTGPSTVVMSGSVYFFHRRYGSPFTATPEAAAQVAGLVSPERLAALVESVPETQTHRESTWSRLREIAATLRGADRGTDPVVPSATPASPGWSILSDSPSEPAGSGDVVPLRIDYPEPVVQPFAPRPSQGQGVGAHTAGTSLAQCSPVTTVPNPWTSSSNRTILARACNPAGTPSSRRW
jgi:hypothetical protein